MATDWVEVADRCFVRRYDHLDVNSIVVAGSEGLVVVDTRASDVQGRELAAHVRALSALPVLAVVNTHQHFDHTYGNGGLREAWPEVPLVAHETVPDAMRETAPRIARMYADEPDDPHGPDVLATELVVPDALLSSMWATDLGDRHVEAVFAGRGHTDGDVVVRVPDADVLLAGDLVEQSAPPSYGHECWPLEWPQTLELVVGLIGDATVVVPGHGTPVDRGFVLEQRHDASDIAGQLHQLAGSGVPVDEALATGSWPFEPGRLVEAVRRGYAQLGR